MPLAVAALWSTSVLIALAAARYAPSVVATPHGGPQDDPLAAEYGFLAIYVAFATVGAVVATRRPRHPIGWLFLVAAWLFAVVALAHGYAHHAVLTGAVETALAQWAGLVGGVLFLPPFVLVTMYLPLVFPDGRLLSPRWRIVVGALAAAVAVLTLVEVLSPGPLTSFPEIDNPLGVPGALRTLTRVAGLIDPLFLPIVVAIGAAVVLRFRRATAAERRQFKWVALPAGLLLVFLPLNEVFLPDASGTIGVVGTVMFFAGFAGLPVGVGIAVLRYRLYDIDRILSRTISYGLLTIVLSGTYAVAAVGLGAGLRLVSGQGSGDLVIAASTLAVAALFQPARRRIQAAVDRRFNRTRYDAHGHVERFGQRLRDELDLDALVGELRGVVDLTVQPGSSSVWLSRDGA